MAINDMFLFAMEEIKKVFVSTNPSLPTAVHRSAAFIGGHNFVASKFTLRKLRIPTITARDIDDLNSLSGDAYNAKSHELCGKLVKHYGYTDFHDIDIYDRADFVLDLSYPIPENFHNKYDLVFDPTSNYVQNILMSYENTSRLLKNGGIKIVVAMMSDQTNRFELNPSPNFLIDFHEQNGFICEKAIMITSNGKILPYLRYKTKATPIVSILPFRYFVIYMVQYVIGAIFILRPPIKRCEFISYDIDAPRVGVTQPPRAVSGPPAAAAGSQPTKTGWKGLVKRILSESQVQKLRRLRRRIDVWKQDFLQRYMAGAWVTFIVLRKIGEGSFDRYRITSHYRALDQTRARPRSSDR